MVSKSSIIADGVSLTIDWSGNSCRLHCSKSGIGKSYYLRMLVPIIDSTGLTTKYYAWSNSNALYTMLESKRVDVLILDEWELWGTDELLSKLVSLDYKIILVNRRHSEIADDWPVMLFKNENGVIRFYEWSKSNI